MGGLLKLKNFFVETAFFSSSYRCRAQSKNLFLRELQSISEDRIGVFSLIF